jgi:hypothetical protein
MKRKKNLGHRRADLLQDQEHSTVPRAQAREVGGEALVKGREAAVLGGLEEAVDDAGVEGGVCWESFFRGFEVSRKKVRKEKERLFVIFFSSSSWKKEKELSPAQPALPRAELIKIAKSAGQLKTRGKIIVRCCAREPKAEGGPEEAKSNKTKISKKSRAREAAVRARMNRARPLPGPVPLAASRACVSVFVCVKRNKKKARGEKEKEKRENLWILRVVSFLLSLSLPPAPPT